MSSRDVPQIPWVVQGDRIGLAAPIREEFIARWTYFNDPEFMVLLGISKPPPYTAEERANIYDELTSAPASALFDIRLLHDRRAIGETFLNRITWPVGTAEIAMALFDPEDREQGFGPEAMLLLCAYAFDVVGLNRLSTRFLTDARGVATPIEQHGPGVGAELVGVEHQVAWAFGRRRDVATWELLRDRFPPHPATARFRE